MSQSFTCSKDGECEARFEAFQDKVCKMPPLDPAARLPRESEPPKRVRVIWLRPSFVAGELLNFKVEWTQQMEQGTPDFADDVSRILANGIDPAGKVPEGRIDVNPGCGKYNKDMLQSPEWLQNEMKLPEVMQCNEWDTGEPEYIFEETRNGGLRRVLNPQFNDGNDGRWVPLNGTTNRWGIGNGWGKGCDSKIQCLDDPSLGDLAEGKVNSGTTWRSACESVIYEKLLLEMGNDIRNCESLVTEEACKESERRGQEGIGDCVWTRPRRS